MDEDEVVMLLFNNFCQGASQFIITEATRPADHDQCNGSNLIANMQAHKFCNANSLPATSPYWVEMPTFVNQLSQHLTKIATTTVYPHTVGL